MPKIVSIQAVRHIKEQNCGIKSALQEAEKTSKERYQRLHAKYMEEFKREGGTTNGREWQHHY